MVILRIWHLVLNCYFYLYIWIVINTNARTRNTLNKGFFKFLLGSWPIMCWCLFKFIKFTSCSSVTVHKWSVIWIIDGKNVFECVLNCYKTLWLVLLRELQFCKSVVEFFYKIRNKINERDVCMKTLNWVLHLFTILIVYRYHSELVKIQYNTTS